MKKMMVLVLGVAAGVAAFAGSAFRVTPYVQHPKPDAMSILWFCDTAGTATLSWWKAGAEESTAQSVQVTGAEAPALGIEKNHVALPAQYKFAHRLMGLEADTAYNYKVVLAGEGGATYANAFRTAPTAFRPVRFVAYSDSETQTAPKTGAWEDPTVDQDDGSKAGSRKYYVSKEEGFASNVCAMAALKPDFVAVAGDLAGEGSDQDNWDQYWKHYAGALNDCAGATPILAAPGNHDYNGYDINSDFGEMGMGKYLTYFEYEPNTANVDADQKQRFHRLDYGPVAVIFIDPNNGPNYDPANTYDKWANEYAKPNDRDTNQCMTEDVCRAPDFNPGSEQYKWIEEQLADAQTNKLFTFLVCHQCPYSIGYHGRKNSETGLIGGEGEYLSGVPTRCYTNLIFKYGVDGWICGHDEICEHSRLTGVEKLPDGTEKPTEVHVYDVGYGGDDLRGARRTSEPNPYEVFRAHVDSPEVYDANGTLVSGGKHYGHLEVNVETNELGQWVCRLQQNYVFVSKNAQTGALSFDTRTYPDVVVLTNTTYQADPPAPPVKLDYDYYVSKDGDDANDGRTLETAFASLAQAVSVADDDESIFVAEGTYATTGTVAIAKKVTVVGAGIDKTVLSPAAELIQGIKMTAAGRISKLTLTGFSTHDTGSALYMSAGTADTIRVTANWQRYISGVSSLNNCAGVYLKNGALLNSSIDHNQAKTGYGGTQGVGIYMENGLVENCDVADNSRNSGEFYGAGIRTSGGTIRNCRILRNVSGGGHDTSNTRGMGLYIVGNATVEDCLIVSNGLNAVWMNSGTVRNCLIIGSKTTATSYTAGVDMSGGTLQNCTIWGNAANNAFSGLKMTSGTAVNNIVFGNGTLGSAVVSGGTFNTNIVDAASAVTTSKAVGNMKADPLLANPEDGDFSLDFASPALDAAAPITAIAHDLAGVTRPQGAAPDIGCYELVQAGGALKCAIVVGQVDWKAGTAPTATARVIGASGEVTYQWYVDGALRSDLEGPTPLFTDLSAGRHTVKLVVSDGTGSAEYTFANAFDLHPTEVWVAVDGGDVYPYASPETAATSLNDAVAAAWSDESSVAVVHIGEGTFYLDAELNLSTPYELLGAGRGKTIVNGCRLPNEFRAAKLGNAKSVLKDLMVTGCTNEVDGSGVYMTAGLLDNVRIYRNQDHKYNLKNGAGIWMSGGTVTNSLIELNSVNSGYGGTQGVGIYMTGGTVVDSVIKDNFRNHGELNGVGVAMCGAGKLIRCVISGNNTMGGGNNASNTRGIGLYMTGDGTVENCLIVSNGIHAVQMSKGTLRNCLVYGHETTSANYTAGIEQSGGTVENCTVCCNVANNAFSGLRMTGGTMVNTIVYGNGESGCALVSGGTFNNNIVDDKSVITASVASDNVVSDPKLKDPANGDFTIGFDSPAVDKGQARTGYAIDFVGTERPQGDAWDIGAYEYAPSGDELTCAIIIGTTQWRGDQRPTAQARVVGGSGSYTYEWYVDGVLSSEDSAEPAFAGLACGTHALKLVVSDGTLTAEDENLTAFTLMPGEVWVDEKGSDTFPYDTSAKAAHSVNAAFAAVWSKADSTGVVHIAAGTYPVTATLTMATPYKLLGAGRDVTTLVGPDLVKGTRMITINAAGSEVRDMSLSGCTNQVEGMVVRMTTGLLENVRIHHNYEGYYEISNALYPGLGVYMTDGVVTNCLIDSNRCPNGYGVMAGVGISISGGLVVDSVIRDNGRPSGESRAMGVQMTGGTLRRCVISGNTTDGAGDKDDRCHGVGLGVEGGSPLIENCVIVSNGHSAVTLGNGTMRNCLVWGHKASRANLPAGVNATDGSGKLINCTLAGNTNTESETWVDLRMTAGTAKNTIAETALVSGGTQANNVFNETVAFKNRARGNYHLSSAAANCIDQGDDSVWNGIADPVDLDGNPRIHRGAKGAVDIGCYEFSATGMFMLVR